MSVRKLTELVWGSNKKPGNFAGINYRQEAYCWPPVSSQEAAAVSGDGVEARVIGEREMRIGFLGLRKVQATRVELSHFEPEVKWGRFNYPDMGVIREAFAGVVERLDGISAPGAAGAIATNGGMRPPYGSYRPY